MRPSTILSRRARSRFALTASADRSAIDLLREPAKLEATPSSTGSSCAAAPASGSSTFIMAAGGGLLALGLTQAMRRRRR